jgi:hypothetical protein
MISFTEQTSPFRKMTNARLCRYALESGHSLGQSGCQFIDVLGGWYREKS